MALKATGWPGRVFFARGRTIPEQPSFGRLWCINLSGKPCVLCRKIHRSPASSASCNDACLCSGAASWWEMSNFSLNHSPSEPVAGCGNQGGSLEEARVFLLWKGRDCLSHLSSACSLLPRLLWKALPGALLPLPEHAHLQPSDWPLRRQPALCASLQPVLSSR